MVNFSDLPNEIWTLIARCTETHYLYGFKTLNSFFFDYWMNIRWYTVSIHTARSVQRNERLLLRVLYVQTK